MSIAICWQGQFEKIVSNLTRTEELRKRLKRAIFASAFLLVSPLILIAWIEKQVSRSELIFIGLGQFLALFPSMIGSYIRAAYYFALLECCSWETVSYTHLDVYKRQHIDCSGDLSVSFRGYRIERRRNGQSEQLANGNRATPGIRFATTSGWVAATVQDFWQNFPKALRWQGGALGLSLIHI